MASDALDFRINPALGSHIHIVGIGGIGTSALAQWLTKAGFLVEGSDAVASDITTWLTQAKIPVVIGDTPAFPTLPDLLIYSDSVPEAHPLRAQAAQASVPQYSYAAALGALVKPFHTVAITGSHGKSSTTALAGLLLEALGLDPTVVIGTRVPAWQTNGELGNYRAGKSQLCVVEADEYRNHFLELKPAIAVITSIDHDHVDAFPTKESYLAAFEKFIDRVDPSGTIVIETASYQLLADKLENKKVITYAMPGADIKADITATLPIVNNGQQKFTVTINGQQHELSLSVPGVHMVGNLLAALGVMVAYATPSISPLLRGKKRGGQISTDEIINVMSKITESFHGTWRRFEAVGQFQGAQAFSDYAHHPTEIKALIKAAHQFYPDNRLVLVLQPHHHNRARAFANEFKQILKDNLSSGDKIVFCEVYGVPGREDAKDAITTKDWAADFNAPYVANLTDLKPTLSPIIQPNDILIFAGAGDIDAAARKLIKAS